MMTLPCQAKVNLEPMVGTHRQTLEKLLNQTVVSQLPVWQQKTMWVNPSCSECVCVASACYRYVRWTAGRRGWGAGYQPLSLQELCRKVWRKIPESTANNIIDRNIPASQSHSMTWGRGLFFPRKLCVKECLSPGFLLQRELQTSCLF